MNNRDAVRNARFLNRTVGTWQAIGEALGLAAAAGTIVALFALA